MAKPSGTKLAFGLFTLATLLGVLGWFFFAAPPPAPVAVAARENVAKGEPPSTAAGRPPVVAKPSPGDAGSP